MKDLICFRRGIKSRKEAHCSARQLLEREDRPKQTTHQARPFLTQHHEHLYQQTLLTFWVFVAHLSRSDRRSVTEVFVRILMACRWELTLEQMCASAPKVVATDGRYLSQPFHREIAGRTAKTSLAGDVDDVHATLPRANNVAPPFRGNKSSTEKLLAPMHFVSALPIAVLY